MKKVLVFLFFAVSIGAGCKKDSKLQSEIPSESIVKFKSIEGLSNSEAMRISFNTLTSTEKADLWRYRIQESIELFSQEKRNLLNDILKEIKPQVFQKGTKEYAIFSTLIVPKWLKVADEVFLPAEINNLFYFLSTDNLKYQTINHNENIKTIKLSLSNSNQKLLFSGSSGGGVVSNVVAPPNCGCNIGSGFTCKKTTTHVGTDGIWQEVTYGQCSSSAACSVKDEGCGFAGIWECDGNKCTY